MVHAAAIARQCDALNTLVNGNMAEARLRRVIWDDIRVDTFVYFMQYIYQGDYSTSIAKRFSIEEKGLVTESDDEEEEETDIAAKEKDDSGTQDISFSSDFWDLRELCTVSELTELKNSFTQVQISRPLIAGYKIQHITTTEDLTPVLLDHARLYVFAEKFQIQDLKALSISKLYQILLTYHVFPKRICAIIELIRCVYSDENTPDRDDPVDELRALVVRYVNLGCVIRVIGNSPEFLDLLEEGGAFVTSVWPLIYAKLI